MSTTTSRTEAPLGRHVGQRVAARMRRQRPEDEMSQTERMTSLAAGTGLAVFGLMRRTLAGFGLTLVGGALAYRGWTGRSAMSDLFAIHVGTRRGPRASIPARHGVRVEESITIDRPREEIYAFWRDFSNLPRVMRHVKSVESLGAGRSRWMAEGPTGRPIAWEAEIITDRRNELISWRSVGDSDVQTAGSVRFDDAPDGRGTEVTVILKYEPPAGKLGAGIAWLTGQSATQQIHEDLRHLKDTMESSASTPAQNDGRARSARRTIRPE